MNFKRVAALLLAGAMVMTAVPVYAKGDDVTLSVSIWDTNQEPGIKEILADFTEKTGIKTEISVVKWDEYWTMLEAGAQGGSLPDVFWMHSNESQRYMSNDMLLDLTDKIKDSDLIDPENYPEDIWGLYTYDDKYYAVPKDIDTIALWYNKTLFDEAGLDYPTADWTWEDFREVAKKLTKDDGSQYGVAIKPGSYQESWYSTIYAYGGEVLTADKKKSGFDEPKTIEAMEVIENIIKDGSMPDYNVVSENETTALMEAGTVAMTFQGSWAIPELAENDYVKENCDIAPLPKGPEGTKSIYNGLGWAASANSENAEGAWKLIEYLGSKEAQQKQAELGVTMSAYEGTSDAWVNSHPEFDMQVYLDMREDAQAYPSSKNTQVWFQMMKDKMVDGFSGAKPMKDVCEDIAVEMNKFLAEE